MAKSPRITVKVPKALKITATERATLKKTFNTEVVNVLRKHRTPVGADITNVNPIIVDMVVEDEGDYGGSAKAGKKAGKKK